MTSRTLSVQVTVGISSTADGQVDRNEAPLVNPVSSEDCPDDMEASDSVQSESEDDSDDADSCAEVAQNLNSSSNTAYSDDDGETSSVDEEDEDDEDDEDLDQDVDDDDDDDDKSVDDDLNDETNDAEKNENNGDARGITIQQMNITMENGNMAIGGRNRYISNSNCDSHFTMS